MQFVADFHIHSRYSMATSKQCDPVNLCLWAARKGLHLIGTGDLTHPKWREELKESLVEDGQGLFRLSNELIAESVGEAGGLNLDSVRFVLSGEISSIYKRGGRTRKVHNVVMVPTFDAADRISERLEDIGNVRSDGRPILGLDSRDLLGICLDECAELMFIPAHIWTPHFSLLGAKSGFDTVEECFGDLTSYLTAMETGLSSDPPMNWRLSALDRFPLVSNSDAHSPANLAREANVFDCELSYTGVREALIGNGRGFVGTLEFFPEEGKYHYDGHRKCGVRWSPAETRENGGICPVCGKQVTQGVLHRVEMLADREPGVRPDSARRFESLVPLSSVISAALGVGVNTASVKRTYFLLLKSIGSELDILRSVPIDLIKDNGGELIAEGVRRVREGQLQIAPGFDGEYGKVEVFTDGERREFAGQAKLFEVSSGGGDGGRNDDHSGDKGVVTDQEAAASDSTCRASLFDCANGLACVQHVGQQLSPKQLEAAMATSGTVVVVAGPGTGKTRTLTYRIRGLINAGVSPSAITAVTFTRKAAAEISERLASLISSRDTAMSVQVGTFHSICMRILRWIPELQSCVVIDETDRMVALEEAVASSGTDPSKSVGALSREISLLKARCVRANCPAVPSEIAGIYSEYERVLRRWHCLDYDDVILATLDQWDKNPELQSKFGPRFRHLLVDEFQDVNEAQYRLVRCWSSSSDSLFVIGDPDQSIYEFRGSDSRYFSMLSSQMSRVHTIRLTDTYRSQRIIAASASSVIANNSGRREPMKALRSESAPVTVIECPSDLSEAIAIVQEIQRLIGGTDMIQAHDKPDMYGDPNSGSDYGFSDIAVMFRTSRQGDILEECLTKAGIPYTVAGQKGANSSAEVEQTLAVVKLMAEPDSAFRWLQCFRLPRYELSRASLRRVARTLMSSERRPDELVSELVEDAAFSVEDRARLQLLMADLVEMRALDSGLAARRLIEQYAGIAGIGWTRELLRLAAVAEEFGSAESMLQGILFGTEADWIRRGFGQPESEHVSLMTIHAAKGLEFPVVFVSGCEEGLLPLTHGEAEAAVEEERRLFYVAMTRAKDCLYLTHAAKRFGHQGGEVRTRSRFISEIPPEYLKLISLSYRLRGIDQNRQVSLF